MNQDDQKPQEREATRSPLVSINIEEGLKEHHSLMAQLIQAMRDGNADLGSILARMDQIIARSHVLILMLIAAVIMMVCVIVVALSTQRLQKDTRTQLTAEQIARQQLQKDLTTAMGDVKILITKLDEVNERTKLTPTIKSEGGQLKLEIPLDEESKKQAQAKLNLKKTVLDKPAQAPDTVLIPLKPSQSSLSTSP